MTIAIINDIDPAFSDEANTNDADHTSLANQKVKSRKEAILDAGLLEFSEHGYEGASLRNIGRRANVDFTLITYYFKTKEKLWIDITTKGVERFTNLARIACEKVKNDGPTAVLKARMRCEMEFAYSNHGLFSIITHELQIDSKRSHWLLDTFIKKARKDVIDLIKRAQNANEIEHYQPELLASMMQVSIRSLLLDQTIGSLQTIDNAKDEDVVEEIWRLFERIYFSNLKPLG
jgi:AcrR family transcriptional regulator